MPGGHSQGGGRRNGPGTPGTSLIALTPAAAGPVIREPRTLATFMAQLIAKSQHAPHLRNRRRASPAEAADAYGRMLHLAGVPNRYKARPF